MDEIMGYSHGVVMARALIHTALWWPTWWLSQWVRGPLAMSLGKMIFYTNNFFMALFWFLVYSIAKGTDPTNKEIVKYLTFWLAIHILMEIPFLISLN